MMTMNNKSAIVAAAAAIAGIIVGGIIGHLGSRGLSDEDEAIISQMKSLTEDKWEAENDTTHKILNMISAENIRQNLKVLSEKPHLAGSPRDEFLARMIRDRFEEAGCDSSELVPYYFLLSRPDPQNPNRIKLYDGSNRMVFNSSYKEQPIRPDDADPDFIHSFLAYTPAGTFRTRPGIGVIYVNYGTIEDFKELEAMGMNVSGHIVMVVHAEQYGAVGVILFSDPKDVALEGEGPEDVYPYKWWLPGTGMQRGTTFTGDGDPLTPSWPSTANAYRVNKQDAGLPTIPAQSIGYNDAKVILEKLGGRQAPEHWIGGLTGINYNIGPQFTTEFSNHSLEISTHNTEDVTLSYNEHVDKLQDRAIAYINTDICASGPSLHAPSSPVLFELVKNITGMVPGVLDKTKTVLEEWKEYSKAINPDSKEIPKMETLGSGSDHSHFIFYAGIPSVDLWFKRNKALHNISIYPSYHTGYETFYMVDSIMDPGFIKHRACGRIASLLLKRLADSAVVPFHLEKFPAKMKETLDEFRKKGTEEKLLQIYSNYTLLPAAIDDLIKATKDFMKNISNIGNDPYMLRAVNDQLMKFEHTFIIPGGLPGREVIRHAVFAPSKFDSYSTSAFPGITDLLFDYEDLQDNDRIMREEEIKKHISLLTILTERATKLLHNVRVI